MSWFGLSVTYSFYNRYVWYWRGIRGYSHSLYCFVCHLCGSCRFPLEQRIITKTRTYRAINPIESPRQPSRIRSCSMIHIYRSNNIFYLIRYHFYHHLITPNPGSFIHPLNWYRMKYYYCFKNIELIFCLLWFTLNKKVYIIIICYTFICVSYFGTEPHLLSYIIKHSLGLIFPYPYILWFFKTRALLHLLSRNKSLKYSLKSH